ncbi:MAG: carboxypeptidase M32 [Leptospiraceae bacterium]|nr:carboxypeptidase M32 [Leptospiraceae bacterium]MCP5496525.1 carboxypeptidase M32 [Leptospiraceae bacterium]
MIDSPISRYRKYWNEIVNYQNILSCLHWDMEVTMPSNGSEERAAQVTQLSSLCHKIFISQDFERLIEGASNYIHKISPPEKILLERELQILQRERDRAIKLPIHIVENFANTTSLAHSVWVSAKKNQNFKEFQNSLNDIVNTSKEIAELYGYKNERYDALLENYEIGMTGNMLSNLFADLKKSIIPIVEQAKTYSNPFPHHISMQKQRHFNERLPIALGLPKNSFRLDVSAHPFSTSLGRYDKRITTRYYENDPLSSIFGVLHETGHSLYEYGLSQMNDYPSPLTNAVSLGLHESQSRLWENQIGRSKAFWEYYYPIILKDFELSGSILSFEDLFNFVNTTSKTKIRVEADQITYNLHIILRFEIERDLISNNLSVSELPEIWNSKMKEYFDLEIQNSSEGVLQDIHWSSGLFGYFPTYTLGNIYSAQLFHCFINHHGDFWNDVKKAGNFSKLLNWLNKNVYQKGKIFDPTDLIQDVTGQPPNSSYLIEYLKTKQQEVG